MLQYEVTITGAVDPDRDEKMAGVFSGMPATYNGSKDIARSNMRFHAVIDQLSLLALFSLADIVVTGRTKDAAASSITFKIAYHRDRPTYLKVEDVNNPGTFLEGADAVKRMIAKAISTDYNQNYSFWDPTVRVTRTNTNTTTQTTPPRGWAYEMVDATKLAADVTTAEGSITVTEI